MVASGKSNSGLATTGAVVAGAGVAADITRKIQKDIKLAEQSIAVPETHILGGPFSVPGQGVLKKWILVGFPQKERPKYGNLILKTVEGEKLTYAFELQDPSSRTR